MECGVVANALSCGVLGVVWCGGERVELGALKRFAKDGTFSTTIEGSAAIAAKHSLMSSKVLNTRLQRLRSVSLHEVRCWVRVRVRVRVALRLV